MLRRLLGLAMLWCLDKMIDNTPENSYQLLRRGWFRLDYGFYEKAVSDFTLVLDLNPEYGDAFRLRALSQLRLERPDLAIEDIRRDLAIRPDNPITHVTHGDVLRALNKSDDALRAYSHAVSLDPTSKNGWAGCGDMHFQRADWESAVTCLRRGIALGSNDNSSRQRLRQAEHNLSVK